MAKRSGYRTHHLDIEDSNLVSGSNLLPPLPSLMVVGSQSRPLDDPPPPT